MSLGLELFRAERKANKATDMTVTTPVAYPSTFLGLDYMNGQLVEVFDKDDEITQSYISCGFLEGSMTTVIADSGLGKSTLVQQIAVSIISPFENSFVQHEDIEQAGFANRVYNISNMKSSWIKGHYEIYQDCHAETVVKRFIDHAKIKLNNRKTFEYNTGLKDMFGDDIITLQPTCMIIDSLAIMRSGEIDFTEESEKTTGNMAGARNAKFNSEIFKQMLPYAKKANILIFVINHITRKVETNSFAKGARDLVGLGENEALPGGRAAVYLANNVLRLKNKKGLKPDSDYGILGNIISATFYKSRTNATLQEVELIFDKSKGFSRLLSMLHYAKENNLLTGSNTKRTIPGADGISFSSKTFLEVARENPRLVGCLYDLVEPHMRTMVTTGQVTMSNESQEQRLNSYIDIMNKINI